MHIRNVLHFAAVCLLWTSCSSGTPTGNPPAPADSLPPAAHAPSDSAHTAQGGDGVETLHQGEEAFADRARRISEALLAETCTETRMDEVDKQPLFKHSRESFFARYQRKRPISGGNGKVIPRWVFKAWRFASEQERDQDVFAWLNGHEHSGGQIQLNTDADALKSPPFRCAFRGNEVYILKNACIYEGPEWEALAAAFTQEMKAAGATASFTVSCPAGKLTWSH